MKCVVNCQLPFNYSMHLRTTALLYLILSLFSTEHCATFSTYDTSTLYRINICGTIFPATVEPFLLVARQLASEHVKSSLLRFHPKQLPNLLPNCHELEFTRNEFLNFYIGSHFKVKLSFTDVFTTLSFSILQQISEFFVSIQ